MQKIITGRELSRSELKDIRNLVITMCANYDGYYKECPLLNGACYMFFIGHTVNPLCKYFSNAVLPLNSALETSLIKQKSNIKECAVCGGSYVPSGRSRFCSGKCRAYAKRVQDRKSQQKCRKNKSAMSENTAI